MNPAGDRQSFRLLNQHYSSRPKISNHPNNEINTPDIIFQFYSPVNNYSEFNIKDRLAIAIRSLKDRCVTIVSLTRVLV